MERHHRSRLARGEDFTYWREMSGLYRIPNNPKVVEIRPKNSPVEPELPLAS